MNMKAAASLTGSLLARKGAAYPASYSAPTPSPEDPDGATDSSTARAYNDPRVIASAPPVAAKPTEFSDPEQQQDEPSQDDRFTPDPAASEAPAPAPAADTAPAADLAPAADAAPAADTAPAAKSPILPAATAGSDAAEGVELPQTMDKMGRVRLSVRLDPDRYLRVKMASARTRWSAQDIVIAALDRYLGDKKRSDSDGSDGGSHGNLN